MNTKSEEANSSEVKNENPKAKETNVEETKDGEGEREEETGDETNRKETLDDSSTDTQNEPRRSKREKKKPTWHQQYQVGGITCTSKDRVRKLQILLNSEILKNMDIGLTYKLIESIIND